MSQNHKDTKNGDPQPSTLGQQREHPSTYWVQDRSNIDEMTRLQLQDQLVTMSMGGVLSEQADPTQFQSVLDVGCGTGGWLIEAAKTYPTLKRLVGIDISNKMLDYAREQAAAQGVGDRVEFQAMDALRMLEFPSNTFHLVNQRFAWSWLRKWDWAKLLREYQRVCQPDGVIRVTECQISESDGPMFSQLNQLLLQALYQAGNFFTLANDSVISKLSELLHTYGIENVQTQTYHLEYHNGTPEGEHFYEDIRIAFRNLQPFMRKWTRVPDDYETLYQQMLSEMRQPEFVVRWNLLTAWGTNSDRNSVRTPERD